MNNVLLATVRWHLVNSVMPWGKITTDALLALHGWEPHAGLSPVSQRVEILDYELTTTKKLAVYEITAEVIRLKR